MSRNVTLISGLLPPAPDGIGIYAARLGSELDAEVEVLHLPSSQGLLGWYRAIRAARRPVMHVQYPSWGASWRQALIPFLLKIAAPRSVVITTFHEWAGVRRLMRWSALPLLLISRQVLTVSRTVQAQLVASKLRRATGAGVVYVPMTSLMEVPATSASPGVEEFRPQLREDWDIVLTHFGFVYAAKQPYRLLEALAIVNAGGLRCRLIFVGGFFEHRPERLQEFRDRVVQMGLDDVVELTGFIEDPNDAAAIIRTSDAAVALYEDGASVRRTSLWYLSQLGVRVITTEPTLGNEFEGTSLDLNDDRYCVLPRDSDAQGLAAAIRLLSGEPFRHWPPLAPPSWALIAEQHRQVYDSILAARH